MGSAVRAAPRPGRVRFLAVGQDGRVRRALLDAARAVFTEQGFADASIADAVERAGSSVSSLYHHFGGRSELFIALWQDYQEVQEAVASEAVARAGPGTAGSYPV